MEPAENIADQLSEPAIRALFERTLTEDEDDEDRWKAIRELQQDGSRCAFEQARDWCLRGDLRQQIGGVDVLAQIGRTSEHPDTLFRQESFPILLAMLQSKPASVPLRDSLIIALHFLENPAAIPAICAWHEDENASIRLAVAHALGYPFANDPLAVQTLLKLTRDGDEDVRDWATFALGVQGDADSAGIREALLERLGDPFPDAKEEAIAALAKRKDLRVLPALIELLQSGELCDCAEEASCSLLDLELGQEQRTAAEYLNELRTRYGA